MNILIISDGISGHVNQAKGLALFINDKIVKSESCICNAKLHRKWMRPLLKLALNYNWKATKAFINYSYKLDCHMNFDDFDLLISAGGNTSFINAYFSKQYSIKNIFIGSLRRLKANLYTAVMTLESIGSDNNIVMAFSPSLTTRESTYTAAQLYQQEHQKINNKIWLMIIGGDGAGCRYNEKDWVNLSKGMEFLAERYEIKWLLTTSRRTGLKNEIFLKKQIPKRILYQAVWYNHKPEKMMQAFLGLSDNNFCTIDSMSMINESISSCVKSNVVKPEIMKLEKRYQEVLVKFENQGLLESINIFELFKYKYIRKESNIKELIESKCTELKFMLEKIIF